MSEYCLDAAEVHEYQHIASLNDPELLYNIIKDGWNNKSDIEFTKSDNKWFLGLDTGEWAYEEAIIAALKGTTFWKSYFDRVVDGRFYYFKGEEAVNDNG